MADKLTMVHFRFPLFQTACLMIRRVPKFIRFTTRKEDGKRVFDALDQLDDTPLPEEAVFAARLKHRGICHVDRTVKGRRVGEWYQTADYVLMEEQPDDATIRDTEKWQAWCVRMDGKKEEPAVGSG